MIYLVSGFMRTGTSMMMEALEAGGMDAVYDNSTNERFEMGSKEEINHAVRNPSMFDGKLLKCLGGGLPKMAAWNWKIIYMYRRHAEIMASYRTLFPPEECGQLGPEKEYNIFTNYTIGQLSARKDVQFVGLDYHAVLGSPLKVFRLLQEDGWPIDAEKAAAVVDPDKCHHLIESAA